MLTCWKYQTHGVETFAPLENQTLESSPKQEIDYFWHVMKMMMMMRMMTMMTMGMMMMMMVMVMTTIVMMVKTTLTLTGCASPPSLISRAQRLPGFAAKAPWWTTPSMVMVINLMMVIVVKMMMLSAEDGHRSEKELDLAEDCPKVAAGDDQDRVLGKGEVFWSYHALVIEKLSVLYLKQECLEKRISDPIMQNNFPCFPAVKHAAFFLCIKVF